jgi:hypothetical protein
MENNGREIWMRGFSEGDSPEQTSVKDALESKVGEVVYKETVGSGERLFNVRHFWGRSLDTPFFDFIQVSELGDSVDDRFLIMLYSCSRVNRFNPRSELNKDLHVYPFGTKVVIILKGLRADLEKGKIPTRAIHQVSVKVGPGGETNFFTFNPCCIEVHDKNDIQEIKDLVDKAVKVGIRDDIITKSPKDIEEILGRIENDDSLDFVYRDSW